MVELLEPLSLGLRRIALYAAEAIFEGCLGSRMLSSDVRGRARSQPTFSEDVRGENAAAAYEC